ncbi:MAG: hypothetical protein JNM89_00650 [Hyphomicrobiaceae bacterium]|nr:hypothetical protein [Hyphomicrobiaceae bacterium]
MKTSTIHSTSSMLALMTMAGLISATTAAEAGFKHVEIDKITGQFDDAPSIKMKDSGNGYVLDEYHAANIRMRLRAKVAVTNWITTAIATMNGRMIYTLPIHYAPKEMDETLQTMVTEADLAKFKDHAVSHCNSFGEVGKISKSQIQIPVRFEVSRDNGIEQQSDTEGFSGVVACGPRKENKGMGDVVAEAPDFKVKGIAVRFLTSAGKPATPNPGTRCQVTTARVRVETTKPGPVKFKLWSKVGSDPISSQVVDAWSSFTGPGKHEAVFEKVINVERSSQVQVMAEEMVNPIGLSTPWKIADLDCDGAGGGGLANAGNNGNPGGGPELPSLKVTGNISLGTKPGNGPTKPRDATVVFRLWANKSGPTAYKLTCTGGHEWTGTVATSKIGNGKYLGHGMKTVHIDKTTQLACAMRSTSMPGDPVVALASKLYPVVKRNPDVAGPADLSSQPRPTHKPSAKPDVKTAPAADNAKGARPTTKAARDEKVGPASPKRTDAGRPVRRPLVIKAATAQRAPGGKETFDVRKPH